MSTLYYSQQWQQAISNLLGCVEEQNYPLQANRNQKGINYKRTDLQWFQYYAYLYIKYLQVYRQIQDAYDQMIHPQKRILMKTMLDNAMIRMCQVKQLMIRYSTHTQIIQSDYINIDQILIDLKLTPKSLQVPIPRYCLDKKPRDQIIKDIVETLQIVEEQEAFAEMSALDTNLQTAIRIIQKLERGRQGIIRGIQASKYKNKNKERSTEVANEEDYKANILQKYWRAYLSRKQLANIRSQELKFLGILKQPINQNIIQAAQKQRCYLKMVQKDRQRKYQKDKENIKEEIKKTQQHNIQAIMKEKRRKWIQKFLQMHQFTNLPKNLQQFYKQKQITETQQLKDKKKDGKKEQGKKSKKNQIQAFIDEHQAIGPTQSVINAQQAIKNYTEIWGTRDTTQVTEQIYDAELQRDNLRPSVEDELQKIVDAQISLELDMMRVKYGIKKKKDKIKKKKKKDQKKVKIPQGIGKINPQQLLFGLFEKGIAKLLKPAHLKDFLGEHNPLSYLVQKNSQTMPDPSLSQIRSVAAQYIGIPLASEIAKQKLQKWSWFLFYGAIGTGKTMIIRALANQTNSLVFDLTPEFVKERYQQKTQLIRLIWSVIICAKEYQPSIIMIDDFETIFSGVKTKKKDSIPSFGPKMKKIIVDMKKNKYWGKNDRIAVISCTNKPYQGNIKDFKKLFDKKIYFPYPNYATRKLLIQNLIESKINQQLTNFPYDSLANITEGYTAGSYKNCIDRVLTQLRIARLKQSPLKLSEFISPLSNSVCVYSEQYDKITKFTDQIMGFAERRQAKIHAIEQEKKNTKK